MLSTQDETLVFYISLSFNVMAMGSANAAFLPLALWPFMFDMLCGESGERG